jgi:SSS family solute:Na+ symporter
VIVVGYIASLFFPKPNIDKNLLFSGWNASRKADNAALKAL